MISKHAEDIIRILIHQNERFVTVKKIAEMAEVSERSVNNYMSEVSDYCEKQGCTLIRKRGKGICLRTGKEKKVMEKRFLKNQKESFENRETRIHYIVCTLIESKEPYTAQLFADELFVSRATIRRDLWEAERQCEKDHLTICQKVGKGIEICGGEFWKRKALVCRNKKMLSDRYSISDRVPDLRMEKEVYSRMVHQYRKEIVDGVILCLQRFEKEIGFQFNDYTFTMVTEYTSCQIRRIKRNCCLEETMISQLTLVEEIADWTDRYLGFLNRHFALNIDPREGLYLYILFLGAEVQNSSRIVNKRLLIEKEINIENVTEELISYLSAITGLEFQRDVLLKTSIALFLNSSLVRVKYGFEIENPFLEEVKKTYSAVFSACLTASKKYEDLVGWLPSEDEISYMAMLFGGSMIQNHRKLNAAVLGTGGIGMLQIAAQKIEAKIPEINVTAVLSSDRAAFIEENQYDLVITTIPDSKVTHPYVVYTTLLVSEQDIYRLKKFCHGVRTGGIEKSRKMTIGSLLRDELILLEHNVITKNDLLKKACDLLFQKGYVAEGFFESVIEREEISVSVLGGGVAVPHGMSCFVKKPAVVVIRTDDKVEWGEGAADVIFLLALNFEDIESTRAFFSAFYEMTMQRESAKMIRRGITKEEIKQVIINNS